MSDLRNYISILESSGDLTTITKQVSTKYEIASITSKVDGLSAILFDNIAESDFRLVSNLVGSKNRFAQALNATVSTIHDKIIQSIDIAEKPKLLQDGLFLKNQSTSASILPVVTHFEKESGPFITSSIVHVKNPETNEQNSSFHRLMPIDDTHFSIRMVQERHLDRCFQSSKKQNCDLPVAITIGVHPAISIASAYQAVWGYDEMNIANVLLDKKLSLCKLPNTGLYVPATTEIVLEGKILSDVTHEEWMVEMLQTYDHKRSQPVFELERLYYQDNPIFHDILSGYTEHRLLMGMPIEAKLNHNLKKLFSDVTSIVLSDGGCNWLHAVVQIKKTSTSDVPEIINKTFTAHRSLKQVTVVDIDIDPNSATAIEYAMATRFQADKDLLVIHNVRGSSLDPSSNQDTLTTSKLGIDATIPLDKKSEGFELAHIPFDADLQDYT